MNWALVEVKRHLSGSGRGGGGRLGAVEEDLLDVDLDREDRVMATSHPWSK
ncbi:hypothetical protein [Nocardia aurea]|uniref:hypothetical protein n=1 Tax=Nocardia aurea TaxID=2144174 RepID=UPI0033BD3DA9